MLTTRRALSAYGQAAQTLPPARQIVLLYEGAIRRIREAQAAIEQGRIRERHAAIEKASAIIDALQACLDLDQGGEIARNLDRLYTDLGFRLQTLNLAKDGAICAELIARLEELRDAWRAIGPDDAPAGTDPATASAGPVTI
jgi:flagellar protein FliS